MGPAFRPPECKKAYNYKGFLHFRAAIFGGPKVAGIGFGSIFWVHDGLIGETRQKAPHRRILPRRYPHAVSPPLIPPLLDEPGGEYTRETDLPPRPTRNCGAASAESAIPHQVGDAMQSAEKMGKKLKQRSEQHAE